MFSALGDLVAPPRAEDDDQEEGEGSQGKEGPPMNFWSMASALRDTVKQRAAEVAQSLQETDWRKELGAFQQGLKEDSVDIAAQTREAVEHLPTVVEQFNAKDASAVLQAKAKEAQQQLQQAGKQLGSYTSKLLMGTTELFEQVKDAIQSEMAFDGPQDGAGRRMGARGKRQLASTPGAKFSRFEADVSAMQRDSSTYCDEPEDEEDFAAWLATFDLAAKRPDIDALIAANTFMAELQARIVPLIVEYDDFWTRYFYRLHKLQQKHDQFMQLTQRANQEEEDLGWGSDEEGSSLLSPKGQAAPSPTMQPAPTAAAAATAEEEKTPAAAEEAAGGSKEEAAKGNEEEESAAVPEVEAPSAVIAPGAVSPTLSEECTVSTGSEVSQVSGGTPERWTVVSSPRASEQPAAETMLAPEPAQAAVPAEPEAASKGKEPKEEAPSTSKAAAAAPSGAKAKAAPKAAPEASSSREAAAPAAAATAVAAAAAAMQPAAEKPEPADKAPAAVKAAKEEEDAGSDLSDFDVEGDDRAADGGADLDENWGDEDWE